MMGYLRLGKVNELNSLVFVLLRADNVQVCLRILLIRCEFPYASISIFKRNQGTKYFMESVVYFILNQEHNKFSNKNLFLITMKSPTGKISRLIGYHRDRGWK